ncbi:hypothetical protein C8J56DRAFT_536550 [Mycena floridula]|nr:hypothetical protein C8J56DRAFT_536550 [Mycena floridula]
MLLMNIAILGSFMHWMEIIIQLYHLERIVDVPAKYMLVSDLNHSTVHANQTFSAVLSIVAYLPIFHVGCLEIVPRFFAARLWLFEIAPCALFLEFLVLLPSI